MTGTPKKRITRIPLWARVPTPLARFARVMVFVVVVAVAVVGIVGYRARAQLTERMIDAGTAMLAYAPSRKLVDDVVRVASAVTPQ